MCLLGRPGVGKTTMLRECARVLSEERKRVVIVDSSNEIAGDSDIWHEPQRRNHGDGTERRLARHRASPLARVGGSSPRRPARDR